MAIGARFAKFGLGQFIFGVFLSLGVVGHYLAGASHPTGAKFMQNITLWWACPWTLSVAAIQAGGLGMAAVGCTLILGGRNAPDQPSGHPRLALALCNLGLFGLFAVGYAGYFVVDAIWPGFYYMPVEEGKNVWLIGQGFFMAVYLVGMMVVFNAVRHSLRALSD